MLRLLVVSLACALHSCGSGESPPSPLAPVDDPAPAGAVADAPPSVETATETATQARPMMVVFSRDYCAPCRIMEPWVQELAREHPSVDIVEVNVDREAQQHLGRFFQITAVPALVFLAPGGHVERRRNGVARKEEMVALLRSLGWAE